MSAKRIAIGSRPAVDPNADSWVRQREGPANESSTTRLDPYTARLTIDVTPLMRGRIKVTAFHQGHTVADLLRELLEREFPDTGGGT